MEVVTERLLHEERKQKEKDSQESSSKDLYASHSKKGMVKCYHCDKLGQLKKNCHLLCNNDGKNRKSSQPGEHKA